MWLLARQAYVTEVVPYRLRATAMSTLGGVFRIGLFIGPFIGAAVVHFTGLWGAYAVHIVAAVVAAGVLLSVKDLSTGNDELGRRQDGQGPGRQVVREQRSVFATLGIGVLVVSAIRAARQVVLPLWGQHLGLSPSAISVIFGISGGIDMLLFYPAGKVMDRFGRRWVAIPSMTVLGISLILVPFTASTAGAAAGRPGDGGRQRDELRSGDDARRGPGAAGSAAGVPRDLAGVLRRRQRRRPVRHRRNDGAGHPRVRHRRDGCRSAWSVPAGSGSGYRARCRPSYRPHPAG